MNSPSRLLGIGALGLLLAACGGGGGGTPPAPPVPAPTPSSLKLIATNAFGTSGGLRLIFSGALDTTTAAVAANYLVQSATDTSYATATPARQAALSSDGTVISLTFPSNWKDGASYQVQVNGVKDTKGLTLAVTPAPVAVTARQITVNTLAERHPISPYVYGVNFGVDANYMSDSGATLSRWGGNDRSRYNWKLKATNSAADYYFENHASTFGANGSAEDFIAAMIAGGGTPIMTLPMLNWVAKDTSSHGFSVAKYGAQQKVDPYNLDAGNGMHLDGSKLTGNDPTDSSVPLLNTSSISDPPGTVYRSEWVAALAAAFGNSPHFYDLDNEPEIWGGTHRDVHPQATSYDEMRDTFLNLARALKRWDPQAVTLGPVDCCWYFYWNLPSGAADKAAHAGIDYLPWWLNEIAFADRVAGARALDDFDIHAYPDVDTSKLSDADAAALRLRSTRDYWDPTYLQEGYIGTDQYATQTQPRRNYPARIPRMRALLNSIYPGLAFSITEWNFVGFSDQVLGAGLVDADMYGVLGRERLDAASRWVRPDAGSPPYEALKLYRNYDGNHHHFGTRSIAAGNDGSPNLFSTYAALDAAGTTLTLMVINKDPAHDVAAHLNFAGFTPSGMNAYILSQQELGTLRSSGALNADANFSFPAYSATLLVMSGSSSTPGYEVELNPDSIMLPSGGHVVLHPRLLAGSGPVTLTSVLVDNGLNASISGPTLTASQTGAITVDASASSPGFYRLTATFSDVSGTVQQQSGWMVVGQPAAAVTAIGDGQAAPAGTTVNIVATLSDSGGLPLSGATVLFTADSGSLAARLVRTDSNGRATVSLTLPALPGVVHVTAEGPMPLGHPTAHYTLTAQ
ncbi:MAG: glycoside hydrolase family 44 protein [Terriglobales bacterium]